jgi:hypothetical protein
MMSSKACKDCDKVKLCCSLSDIIGYPGIGLPPGSLPVIFGDPIRGEWTQADLKQLVITYSPPSTTWFSGVIDPLAGIGDPGDFYLNSVTGDFFEKTGPATWTLMGNLQGPAGSQILTGSGVPSGALGIIGDFYLDTVTGNYYLKTAVSTWTFQAQLSGPVGPGGPPGSQILTGSGVPAGGLGVVSDFYIDTVTGNYYLKTGVATWTFRAQLTGPTGATGPASNVPWFYILT